MAGILKSNFQPGDWLLLAQLEREISDKDDYHALEMNVLEIQRENSSGDAIPILIRLYENGHCSYCRSSVVWALSKLDAVPGWMMAECKYDIDADLHDEARREFKDDDND